MLKNARKRLLSFSKPSTVDEEIEPDHGERRFSSMSNRSSGSVGDVSQTTMEKIKPSSFTFLLQESPMRVWKEVEHLSDDASNFDRNEDRCDEEKVLKNAQTGSMVACRVIKKFSEDHFDDYLFEIGLLHTLHPRLEHYMAEIEILRELNSSNVVKFYDAHWFENKLWVY
jgi:hypothetical protein